MITKAENLQDLEYLGNITLCMELAIKWGKLKPNNKEIKELSRALTEIAFYNNRLKQDLATWKLIASEYRYDKNKVKLELQELNKKYDNLKKIDLEDRKSVV